MTNAGKNTRPINTYKRPMDEARTPYSGRRVFVVDLDTKRIALSAVASADLAALDLAGISALRAALDVLNLALAGDAR